jgi:hypothetical protein
MNLRSIFTFPNPVNEYSARWVAGGVVALSVATLALDEPWLLVPLAYGFVARVLSGPTLSPLGQLVTRVIVPRLPFEAKWVAGPPKRFAQAVGVVFTVSAVIVQFGFGSTSGLTDVATALVGVIVVAASLESFLGICIGCKVFAVLMRFGVVPNEVCERCNDIWAGRQTVTA